MRLRPVMAAAVLLVFASQCACASAVLDAAKAKETALRADRDPVEGVWAVPQKWDPDPEQALAYRLAVVRNDYDVYKDAKYLGIVLCVKKGLTQGEVKLLLAPTGTEGEFDATWLTNAGEVKGRVALVTNDLGEKYAAIDTSALTIDGRILVKALVRVKEEG